MKQLVYTVIVTYNAMKWIEKCLNTLYSSEFHTDIVVVDNCSTDNTVLFIENGYPEVHIIKNKINKGFGQANNQGIEYAYKNGATHFFLCNQDLYIRPDTLRKLIDIQDKYGLFIASPLQMNGTFELFDLGFYNAFVRNNNLFVSCLVNSCLQDYYETTYVPAAAWMLSRECIEKIGGFDPIFFHYSEDNNYVHRILYHKKKIGVVPNAIVGHDRIFKGSINAYNKYSPLSTLLSFYANPSYGLLTINKERIKAHFVYLKRIFLLFLHLEMNKSAEQLINYIRFWFSLRKINNSIKVNRTIHHNWLKLNID